jgi:hypothetical protein
MSSQDISADLALKIKRPKKYSVTCMIAIYDRILIYDYKNFETDISGNNIKKFSFLKF